MHIGRHMPLRYVIIHRCTKLYAKIQTMNAPAWQWQVRNIWCKVGTVLKHATFERLFREYTQRVDSWWLKDSAKCTSVVHGYPSVFCFMSWNLLEEAIKNLSSTRFQVEHSLWLFRWCIKLIFWAIRGN